MTHDVYGYRNGEPFAVLTRRFGPGATGSSYAALDPTEHQPPVKGGGSMVWRTTEQMRTALALLPPGEDRAEERRFITRLLEASLEEGGVWVCFN